eukprot:4176794-Pleurochrysis_carterae.AAC.1
MTNFTLVSSVRFDPLVLGAFCILVVFFAPFDFVLAVFATAVGLGDSTVLEPPRGSRGVAVLATRGGCGPRLLGSLRSMPTERSISRMGTSLPFFLIALSGNLTKRFLWCAFKWGVLLPCMNWLIRAFPRVPRMRYPILLFVILSGAFLAASAILFIYDFVLLVLRPRFMFFFRRKSAFTMFIPGVRSLLKLTSFLIRCRSLGESSRSARTSLLADSGYSTSPLYVPTFCDALPRGMAFPLSAARRNTL